MTLYALLLYAVTTSTGTTDSDRLRVVLANAYRDQPSLELATAGQLHAPTCLYFCGRQDPQEVEVMQRGE